ncbi:unnamed protein product [Amoebophrya sp. A25]|nr:unnamed protein product [Amoebophrya sp. A25]|eukprot:GSA25T00027107001.1
MVHRARGRYDMLHGIWGHPTLVEKSTLYQEVLLPCAKGILGSDCRLEFNGALVTEPGAAEQLWHADGQHLFCDEEFCGSTTGSVLPAHCVNFFVPLVDITDPRAGGTEFCIGSHVATRKLGTDVVWQRADWKDSLDPTGWSQEIRRVQVQAGQVLCFDYRVLHRALEHNVDFRRPVLYWTFVRPWFTDALNFGGLPSLGFNKGGPFGSEDASMISDGTTGKHKELRGDITDSSCWITRLREEQYPKTLGACDHRLQNGIGTVSTLSEQASDVQRQEIFADGAAGSQTPKIVADAMRNYMLENGSTNLGGAYRTSEAALAQVTRARAAAAAFLGCADGSKVAFGANCTNLMFHLAHTLDERLVAEAANLADGEALPRKNIVLSRACHDANVAPWLLLAKKRSLEVRWVETMKESTTSEASDILNWEAGASKIDENTILVALGLASNATGRVHWPGIEKHIVPKVVQLRYEEKDAKAKAATTSFGTASSSMENTRRPMLVLDGTHYVPHFRFDLQASGADAILCSAYKFCGPHLGLVGFNTFSDFISPEIISGFIPKVGRRFNILDHVKEEEIIKARVHDDLEQLGHPQQTYIIKGSTQDVLPASTTPTPEGYEISAWEMGTLNYEALAGLEACVMKYYAEFLGGGEGDSTEGAGAGDSKCKNTGRETDLFDDQMRPQHIKARLEAAFARIQEQEKKISAAFLEKIKPYLPDESEEGVGGKTQNKRLLRLHGSTTAANRTPTFALSASTSSKSKGPTSKDENNVTVSQGEVDDHDQGSRDEGSLCDYLNRRGVFCTVGNHYAPQLAERVQEEGMLTRISFLHYSSVQDVERVAEIVGEYVHPVSKT